MRKKDRIVENIDLRDYFGKGVSLKESRKSINKRKEKFFVGLMRGMIEMDNRTLELVSKGINIIYYEDPYHQVIEGLINEHYGETRAEIIFWWLEQRIENPDKEIIAQFGEDEEVVINTPLQLYKLLLRVEKLLKE